MSEHESCGCELQESQEAAHREWFAKAEAAQAEGKRFKPFCGSPDLELVEAE
jgi:hypothetical protein